MTPPVVKKSGFPRQLNDEIWVITLNLVFKIYKKNEEKLSVPKNLYF